jgi:predicted transposase YbfD/YdcC
MVSAWAEGNGLVLGQRKVDEKSNEITAIPKLLNALELAGTVVTIDAMGCQREIASLIVEKKADYVLAVKENQGLLAEQVRDSFLLLESDAVAEEIDCGHGRVEQRRCSVIADLSMIEKPRNGRPYRGWCVSRANATTRFRAKSSAKSATTSPASAGCGAAEHGDPPALGHRKQTALGARRGLRRRPGPQTRRTCGAKLLACSTASP